RWRPTPPSRSWRRSGRPSGSRPVRARRACSRSPRPAAPNSTPGGPAARVSRRRPPSMPRTSIEIDTFRHANPIPAASRVGPLLVSSIIPPRDPGGEGMPDDVGAQLTNLFHHVGAMLDAAGADWRHVAKMTFYVADIAVRDAINQPWTERFPDPA